MTWNQIAEEKLAQMAFPLADVVDGSVFYPASGFDGTPVRVLRNQINRFVYADYSKDADQLMAHLAEHPFTGYRIIHQRAVTEAELTPQGYVFPDLPGDHGFLQQARARWWIGVRNAGPFALWTVFEREPGLGGDHGPDRFSLLYIGCEGAATYQAIYNCNGFGAKCIAIIQPGAEYMNNFRDPEEILHRIVMDVGNEHAPTLFLQGAWGQPDGFHAFWPEFSEFIGALAGEGMQQYIDLWKRPV